MNQEGCVPPARLAGAAAVAAKAAALRRLGFGGLRGGLQHRAPLNQAQKMEKSRAPANTKCPVAWHEAVCTSQAAFAWSPTTPALKVKGKVISLSYHGPMDMWCWEAAGSSYWSQATSGSPHGNQPHKKQLEEALI